MWIYLGFLSAVFLSLYNICKKSAVNKNAVMPVLFLSTFSSLLFLVLIHTLNYFNLFSGTAISIDLQDLSLDQIFLISIKSILISLSWTLGFFSLKNLPISLVSPIRNTSPLITVIGVTLFYDENLNIYQWIGFTLVICSVFLNNKVGKLEGINLFKNMSFYGLILGTFLGACSGLYDKFLIQREGFDTATVQFWFTLFNAIFTGFILFSTQLIKPKIALKNKHPFQFRWTIPLIGLFLLAADYAYFKALEDKEAMLLILSAIKKSQLILTVLLGGWLFKEINLKKKSLTLALLSFGLLIILFSK